MKRKTSRSSSLAWIAILAVASFACAPEVGSDAWCERMNETPKGDWSMNEAGDYAKHCLMR